MHVTAMTTAVILLAAGALVADEETARKLVTIKAVELFRGEMKRLKPHLGVEADAAFEVAATQAEKLPVDAWVTFVEDGNVKKGDIIYTTEAITERGKRPAEITLTIKNFGSTQQNIYSTKRTYVVSLAAHDSDGHIADSYSGRKIVEERGRFVRRQQVIIGKPVSLSKNEPTAVWAYVSDNVNDPDQARLKRAERSVVGDPLERVKASEWAFVLYIYLDPSDIDAEN